jgi:hypothetical protein
VQRLLDGLDALGDSLLRAGDAERVRQWHSDGDVARDDPGTAQPDVGRWLEPTPAADTHRRMAC